MKKTESCGHAFLLFVIILSFSCKKNIVNNNGNPTDSLSPIVTPPDPEVAKSVGFFLDDWQPKTFVAPSFIEVTQPSADATTTININAGSIIIKVSKYLFGNNSNPYMTQIVTEPVLLNYIKNLSPHIIRFPGGNISSVYLWNNQKDQHPADAPDTLTDADGNKFPKGYWFGKNSESWTLSVDNYYQVLQQTGSGGIITINYAYARYGTSADPVATAAHLAADWVRYDNGRTKYWEIGNESNGVWQAGYRIDVSKNKDGQPEIITGELYGRHFKVFADSMKNAAGQIGKTIYIGAQLLEEAPASWTTTTDKTWNTGIFGKAGNTPDYYIVHNYYTPYNANSDAADILNSAGPVTKNMMDYVQQQTQAGGVSLKPIALTEWNIFAVGSKQMVSHIAGLHADMVLGELIKNNYGEASRWDLANGWSNGDDQGMFNNGDEPGVAKWNPRPAFYHMYYFQKYFGDRMVPCVVSGNTGNIVSYAFTYTSGEAGTIIINKGTTNEIIKITSNNFNAGNRFYWFTLEGDNDNGEFSRKVLINSIGPSGVSGGPGNYTEIKANSSLTQNGIKLSVPPQSAVFLIIDKK